VPAIPGAQPKRGGTPFFEEQTSSNQHDLAIRRWSIALCVFRQLLPPNLPHGCGMSVANL